jgi:ABC-type Fe3+/spermidine/putrescine transport system ATPase subunit
MRAELSLIQRRLGVTTLFVTHDQVEALSMSDRIAVMNSGKIEQVGVPRDIYQHPVSEFVAGFIGNTNLIHGTVEELRPDETAVIRSPIGDIVAECRFAAQKSDRITVAVRPEEVGIWESDGVGADLGPNQYNGEVEISLFGGTAVEYHVRSSDDVIKVRTSPRLDLARGARVVIEIPMSACRLVKPA